MFRCFSRCFSAASIAAMAVTGMPSDAWAAPFSLTTLHSFNGFKGGGPINDNEVAIGRYLYGTTAYGNGASTNGIIYRLNLATGTEQVLYRFTGGDDGCLPSGMTLYKQVLYATAVSCGAAGYGTVFSLDVATGAEHTLYSFQNGADGSYPQGNLRAFGGYLWGTADYGGANGAGTIFRLDPQSGIVTPIHSFGAGSDAAYPPNGLIVQDGILYGVTQYGGTNNTGAVYAYDTADGHEKLVYSYGAFGGADGYRPASELFYQTGYLYGTAQAGGKFNQGVIFRVDLRTRTEEILHNFRGKPDGAVPYNGLVTIPGDRASGLLYGAASIGGQHDKGTLFSIDPASASFTTLYSFSGPGDGAVPYSQLSAANGVVYGSTAGGGAHGKGTLFSFTP